MPEAVARSMKATSVGDFMEAAAPLAGCKNIDEFYQENNPIQFFTGNQIVPCLSPPGGFLSLSFDQAVPYYSQRHLANQNAIYILH